MPTGATSSGTPSASRTAGSCSKRPKKQAPEAFVARGQQHRHRWPCPRRRTRTAAATRRCRRRGRCGPCRARRSARRRRPGRAHGTTSTGAPSSPGHGNVARRAGRQRGVPVAGRSRASSTTKAHALACGRPPARARPASSTRSRAAGSTGRRGTPAPSAARRRASDSSTGGRISSGISDAERQRLRRAWRGLRPSPSRRRSARRPARRRASAKKAATSGSIFSGFWLSWSSRPARSRRRWRRRPGRRSRRCRCRSAWPAAGPTPAPRRVALWSGRGTMSFRALERLEPAGVDEAGADEHVLVGEGQHGPAELVGIMALSTVSRLACA